MRLYVDTSALVTTYLEDEEDTDGYRLLLFESNHVLVTSDLTIVEAASAFHRAARAGRFRAPDAYIDRVEADCSPEGRLVTVPLDVVMLGPDARRLLGDHVLSAADALHLATAMILRVGGDEIGFVTRDRRLAEAARSEGFEVV